VAAAGEQPQILLADNRLTHTEFHGTFPVLWGRIPYCRQGTAAQDIRGIESSARRAEQPRVAPLSQTIAIVRGALRVAPQLVLVLASPLRSLSTFALRSASRPSTPPLARVSVKSARRTASSLTDDFRYTSVTRHWPSFCFTR